MNTLVKRNFLGQIVSLALRVGICKLHNNCKRGLMWEIKTGGRQCELQSCITKELRCVDHPPFTLRDIKCRQQNGKNKSCLKNHFTFKFWYPVAFETGAIVAWEQRLQQSSEKNRKIKRDSACSVNRCESSTRK